MPLVKLNFNLNPLGNTIGILNRLRYMPKTRNNIFRRIERAINLSKIFTTGFNHATPVANAEQNILRLAIFGREIMRVARYDQGEIGRLGQNEQFGIHFHLAFNRRMVL